MENTDLKEIQKKAYTSYHQDGLLDIFAGTYFSIFATAILLDYIWDYSLGVFIPGILLALILPLWIASKRKITIPRIGYVKFGTRGSKNLSLILTGLTLIGVIFFFAFTLPSRSSAWIDFIFENGLIFIGVAGLVISSLFGYSMGLKRLYIYGLLVFTLFSLGYFFGIFFAYLTFALGIAITTAGLALLIKFVKKYPIAGE